jgi:hypothetical protein
MTTIVSAEKAWRQAYAEHERQNSVQSLRAEQDAWDRYAELCDEAQQCLTPGCRVISPHFAYCPQHVS